MPHWMRRLRLAGYHPARIHAWTAKLRNAGIHGTNELIARNEEDYIRIALRITADHEWRRQIVERIHTGSQRIFNQDTPLRQMERFFYSEFNQQDAPPPNLRNSLP